ncbi:MAG: porphobilinogen synthase, partial [Alphaproteobacteria bacterium]
MIRPASRHGGTLQPVNPAPTTGTFPNVRMRRNRRSKWSRRLVAEHRLSVDDLIWPLFVV